MEEAINKLLPLPCGLVCVPVHALVCSSLLVYICVFPPRLSSAKLLQVFCPHNSFYVTSHTSFWTYRIFLGKTGTWAKLSSNRQSHFYTNKHNSKWVAVKSGYIHNYVDKINISACDFCDVIHSFIIRKIRAMNRRTFRNFHLH